MEQTSAQRVASSLCHQLSESWTNGRQQRLDHLLAAAPVGNRQFILQRLLQSEMQLRLERGKIPSRAELCKEYKCSPAFAAELSEAYSSLDGFLRLPEKLGRYLITEHVKDGGQGRIVKAKRPYGRQVLLKYPLKGNYVDFIDREETLTRKVRHPYLRRYIASGTDHGVPYLVMQWIDGLPFGDAVKVKEASVLECCRWVFQATLAVRHLHENNICHCDVNPSNILVDKRGKAILIDLAFGSLLHEDGQGEISFRPKGGTEFYWPPEVHNDDAKYVGALFDIYALGGTLFYALTKRHPGSTWAGDLTWDGGSECRWDPGDSLKGTEHKQLADICRKALSYDASDRYQSAKALAEDIRACLPLYYRHEIGVRRSIAKGLSLSAAVGVAFLANEGMRPNSGAALAPAISPKNGETKLPSVPPWYLEIEEKNKFRVTDISKKNFAFRLKRTKFGFGTEELPVPFLLKVNITDLPPDFYRYLHMRTHDSSPWKPILLQPEGGMYFEIGNTDYLTSNTVRLKLDVPAGNLGAKEIGPIVTDYCIRKESLQFHNKLRERFAKLCESEWAWSDNGRWRFTGELHEVSKDTLLTVSRGHNFDQMGPFSVQMGGGFAPSVRFTGRNPDYQQLYIQLVCLDGTKSGIKRYAHPQDATRTSLSLVQDEWLAQLKKEWAIMSGYIRGNEDSTIANNTLRTLVKTLYFAEDDKVPYGLLAEEAALQMNLANGKFEHQESLLVLRKSLASLGVSAGATSRGRDTQ